MSCDGLCVYVRRPVRDASQAYDAASVVKGSRPDMVGLVKIAPPSEEACAREERGRQGVGCGAVYGVWDGSGSI